MSYRITSTIDPAVWVKFIYNHPHGNIFQAPEMYEVYSKTKNYKPIFLAAEDDNKNVIGILLAVIQKEHKGILGKFSARSIIIGGPLVKDNKPEIIEFLLKEYNKEIKGKAIYTQIRNHWEWNKTEKKIFEKYGFVYEPHLDIIHDLTVKKEDIWNNITGKARNKIRKSLKNNIVFDELKSINNVTKSYKILEEVYKNAKQPLADYSLFKNAYLVLFDKGMLKIFGALYNKNIVGIRIQLIYCNCVYDWYAGSKSQYYKFNPNDFLPWKVIEWGSKNGYKYFDFGGAGKPNIPYGVRDHKLKFGGKLVEFGRFEKIHNRFLFQIGKIGLKLYKKIK